MPRLKPPTRLSLAFIIAAILALTVPWAVLADDISNDLDGNIDATLEELNLTAGGSTGTVGFFVQPRNGDGKNGCNITGQTKLVVSVNSSNAAVATVSPSEITFTSCDSTPTISVTPVGEGTAHVTLDIIENTAQGSFNLAPAAFTVTVAPATPADTTPPVTTHTLSGTEGDNGWYTSAVEVTLSATDDDSGVAATYYTVDNGDVETYDNPFIVSGDGTHTVTYWSEDNAGNTEIAKTVQVKIDTTAPTIEDLGPIADPDGNNGWYVSAVTNQFRASDAGAGFDGSPNPYDFTQSSGSMEGDAVTIFSGPVSDVAGNTNPGIDSQPVKIDLTAPYDVTGAPNRAPDHNGWYNSPVEIVFTGSDDVSGIDRCTTVPYSGPDGTGITVDGDCTDVAGNASAMVASSAFDYDATPPTVSVTGVENDAEYILGSVPAVGCETSDTTSGVASEATLTLSGGPVGTITATCSGAEDNAGNAADPVSKTYRVIYNFTGFFSPIKMGVTNEVKAGSAVPIKFSLSGYQGMDVLSSLPTVTLHQCDAGEATAIVDADTPGKSALSYDPKSDQYSYVWKTEKGWKGCGTLTVTLNDGTEHTAQFKFK